MRSFTYTVVSISCSLTLGLAPATFASAKDRPPEPIENPGECPIDAPLRVANLDALRHFEGLIGHCPETAIIESPAWQANQPRARTVNDGNAPDAVPAWQIPPERGPRETNFETAREHDLRTRSVASQDGSQVAIRPGAGAWEPVQTASFASAEAPAPAQDGASKDVSDKLQSVSNGDSSQEVAAVLALRPRSYTTVFDQTIAQAAREHRVDPLLLHAVIKQESAYKSRATSRAGARGLMQMMPGTGRMLGVRDSTKLYDPSTNVNAGAKLLSQLWNRYDGNIDLVLAAYNAGEGAVRKYGGTVPPYRETRDYVVKVKANYKKLAAESGLTVNF
ncbi:MAG: lytic transglycosylase domain-containing protein [Erythrobacter sp.]